jgi:hypothetical protein
MNNVISFFMVQVFGMPGLPFADKTTYKAQRRREKREISRHCDDIKITTYSAV